jgi:hypothetical protein
MANLLFYLYHYYGTARFVFCRSMDPQLALFKIQSPIVGWNRMLYSGIQSTKNPLVYMQFRVPWCILYWNNIQHSCQLKTEHVHMMSPVIFFKCFSLPIWSTFHMKERGQCWSWLNYVNALILVVKGNLLVFRQGIVASMCSFNMFTVALQYANTLTV